MNPRGWIFTGALAAVVIGFAGAAIWSLLLFSKSLGTHERRLAPLEEKTFGWFDPHLHGALLEARRVPDWGDGPERLQPEGQLWLVTFRLVSSAVEIEIDPSFLKVRMVDAAGNEYAPLDVPPLGDWRPVPRIERASLGPDGELTLQFLFDLPESAERPALWVTDPIWINKLIPGHENSFLHPKVVFEIE